MIPIYKLPRVFKFTETQSIMVASREGKGVSVYWVDFPFGKMKKLVEVNGDDDCPTICMSELHI